MVTGELLFNFSSLSPSCSSDTCVLLAQLHELLPVVTLLSLLVKQKL